MTFVKHALDTTASTSSTNPIDKATSHVADMNLHVSLDEEQLSDADSDDDMEDSERFTPDDEMTETSINLLLSILEGQFVLQHPIRPH